MQAWEQPAGRDVIRGAVLKVLYLMEPDASGDRLKALVAYLADQDYSEAEIIHAANTLPRDDELDQKIRYKGNLTPADWHRVIQRTRTVRDRIDKPMGPGEMQGILELEPQLSRSDFDKVPAGADPDHEYRYVLKDQPLEDLFGKSRTRDDVPEEALA